MYDEDDEVDHLCGRPDRRAGAVGAPGRGAVVVGCAGLLEYFPDMVLYYPHLLYTNDL